jgi:heme exporter protein C
MSVIPDTQQLTMTDAPRTRAASRPRLLTALTIITIVALIGGLALALFYAGTDTAQGPVQRLFYIHVAAFSGAFVAFCATVVGGILYLRTRQTKWDTLALAGVEVGFALALINLTLGMVWARPIWNTWWTWDPRLTSAAVMMLTYAAYLMLRNGIENPDTRRRFASIYGILAIVTVIITLIIIRIEPRTIHPAVIGASPQNAEGTFEMTDTMRTTLGVNSAIWSILLPWTLMWYRIRLQNLADHVHALKARALEK